MTVSVTTEILMRAVSRSLCVRSVPAEMVRPRQTGACCPPFALSSLPCRLRLRRGSATAYPPILSLYPRTAADHPHHICEGTPHLDTRDLNTLGYYEWRDGLIRGIAAHHAGLLPPYSRRS